MLQNQQSGPWLVSGDFNEILYSYENVSGVSRDDRRMEKFRGILEDCSLMYLGYS